jgi:hypothetical protein
MVSIATAIKKTVVPDFGLWLASRMISHVKFITIPTRDQDRAVKFWTERAGFVLTDQPFGDSSDGSSCGRIVGHPRRAVRLRQQESQTGHDVQWRARRDNVEQGYRELIARA